MITMEIKRMGRFSVEFEVANHRDVALAESGHLDPAKIRRAKLKGLIDSGATRLVLPASVVKLLGLPVKKEKVKAEKKVAKLDQPLSILTREFTHVEVHDIEAYVNRSAEQRRKEVDEGKVPGKVKRPMNSFMLRFSSSSSS